MRRARTYDIEVQYLKSARHDKGVSDIDPFRAANEDEGQDF
jgi:hypothetical protein